MERDDALELLRSQHDFPGTFEFRVVVPPDKKELTVAAMTAAAGDGVRVERIGERFSRNRTYVALHVRMHLPEAERVLDVYAVIKTLDYVLATM